MSTNKDPIVGVIMGSISDLETVLPAIEKLEAFGVLHEKYVVSAHRIPRTMFEYAESAESRGLKVIIAAAGGAAHLPGMVASSTILPVIGIPVMSKALHGMDSLLSIVQMPAGIPVATMAIGTSGAENAALMAIRMLALEDETLKEKLREHERSLQNHVNNQNATLAKQ